MTDLPNRVSKQQIHFIAIIIVIPLENFSLRTVTVNSRSTSVSCTYLPHYLQTVKCSPVMQQYHNKQTLAVAQAYTNTNG